MTTIPTIYVAALVAAAFVFSSGLTRLMIVVGPKLGLMDEPDERRVHQVPIPRAGGISIWISFLMFAWIARFLFPEAFTEVQVRQLWAFSLSSLVLMLVGFVDDRQGMNALVKLGGQVLAACLFFYLDSTLWEFSVFGFDLPMIVAGAIFVAWCVLLINAFNLIDGLDGLCSGLVLVSLFAIAGLGFAHGAITDAVTVSLMIAAVAGFIRYNFNPAKIFLGDAGSMMLGFFLATSATHLGGERAVLGSVMLPIAIAGVPLLDVLLAVWRRSARNHLSKKNGAQKAGGVFSADKDHLHHRFLAMGLTQRRVALILQGFAVLLAALCFVPMLVGGRGLVITLCGILILGLFGLRHFARVELVQTGSLLHLAVKRRQGRAIVRAMHYCYDIVAILLAGFLAITIETNFGARNVNGVWSVNFLVLFLMFEIVALQILRIYRRIWSRPALREFFLVSTGLTISALMASSVWSVSKEDVNWADFRCGFIGAQIAMWFVLIPRALPEVIRELAVDSRHRKLVRKTGGRKQILVYGAGMRGNLFLEFLKNCAPEELHEFNIAGFLDENPKLRRRTLQGFKIFGGLEQLEELSRIYPLHGIMVTITHMPEDALRRVFDTASELNLKVYQWTADTMPREVGFDEVRFRKVV